MLLSTTRLLNKSLSASQMLLILRAGPKGKGKEVWERLLFLVLHRYWEVPDSPIKVRKSARKTSSPVWSPKECSPPMENTSTSNGKTSSDQVLLLTTKTKTPKKQGGSFSNLVSPVLFILNFLYPISSSFILTIIPIYHSLRLWHQTTDCLLLPHKPAI